MEKVFPTKSWKRINQILLPYKRRDSIYKVRARKKENKTNQAREPDNETKKPYRGGAREPDNETKRVGQRNKERRTTKQRETNRRARELNTH